jgi:hypothetical protein
MAYNAITRQIADGGRIDMSTINYAFINGLNVFPTASTIKAFGAIAVYDAAGNGTPINVGPPPGVSLGLGYFRGKYFVNLNPSTIVYSSSGTIMPPSDRSTPTYMLIEIYGAGGGGGGGGGSYWVNSGQFPTIYAGAAGGGGSSGTYIRSINILYDSSLPIELVVGTGTDPGIAGQNSLASGDASTKGGDGSTVSTLPDSSQYFIGYTSIRMGYFKFIGVLPGNPGYGGANSTVSGEPSQNITVGGPGSGGAAAQLSIISNGLILDDNYANSYASQAASYASQAGSAGGVGDPGTGSPGSPGYINYGKGGINVSGVTYGKGGNGGMGGKYNVTFPTTLGVPTAGSRGDDGVAIITWHFKYDVPLRVAYGFYNTGTVQYVPTTDVTFYPPGNPVRFDYELYGGGGAGGGGGGAISDSYSGGAGGSGFRGEKKTGSVFISSGDRFTFIQGRGGNNNNYNNQGTDGSNPTPGIAGENGDGSNLSVSSSQNNYATSVMVAYAAGGRGGGRGQAAISGQTSQPRSLIDSDLTGETYGLFGSGGAGGSGILQQTASRWSARGIHGGLVITWFYS